MVVACRHCLPMTLSGLLSLWTDEDWILRAGCHTMTLNCARSMQGLPVEDASPHLFGVPAAPSRRANPCVL